MPGFCLSLKLLSVAVEPGEVRWLVHWLAPTELVFLGLPVGPP